MSDSRYRILWKGQIDGPYTREQVEAMLAKNEIGVWAEISEGNSEWKPISEWRIRKTAFQPQKPKPVEKPREGPKLSLEKEQEAPNLPPLPSMATSHDAGSYDHSQCPEAEYTSSGDGTSDKGFFYWAFQPIAKYAVFSGRARRKEFWGFCLVNFIIGFILGFIEGFLGIAPDVEESVLVGLYSLLVLLPSLAVSVRRLHDTNRSGWWILLSLTGIGYLVLLLFWVQGGADEKNKFGPSPIG